MNWEAVSAVGEIVGAIAVVGSLIFLGLQIRSQNRESRFAAMHEISEAFRDSISQTLDPGIAEILTKAGQGYDSLTDSEKMVVTGFVQRILRVWEEAYHQHQLGRLSDSIWDVMVTQYAAFMSAEGIARVWSGRKIYYDPAFRSFVDSIQTTQYSIPGVDSAE